MKLFFVIAVYACSPAVCDTFEMRTRPLTLPDCLTMSQIVAAKWQSDHPDFHVNVIYCRVPEA